MSDLEYIAASEIVLPPYSTGSDLQNAIDNAASGDTIIVSGDMSFSGTVTLPAGKEITIQSDLGNNWVMSQSNTRHFSVAGTLILRDITLDGMHSSIVNGGGGIDLNNGDLEINEGVVIQNCYTSNNGGAIQSLDGNIIINGGIISSNMSEVDGGGIHLSNSDFTMVDGTIINNRANNHGGGISLISLSSSIMTGGKIINNTAVSSGGGIYMSNSPSFAVYEGMISDNTSNYGGGFYLADSYLEIDLGIISGNKAYYGGGIYIRFYNYSEVSTSINTVFSCNRSNAAHEPPADAGTLYPNIQFAGTTISNHPLNDYDICYLAGVTFDATFHITYDANGGIGNHIGPGIEPCDTDTALPVEDTGINRHGYTFAKWNTLSDGSGDSYAPEDEITISSDITLYAQWDVNFYSVNYDANGGSGEHADSIEYDTIYTVLSLRETGISRILHILTAWNTQPDGSGTSFVKGDTFVISGDVTLYAQWKEITRNDAVNLILISIAAEELAIGHILNAEGEKLQCVLGTLDGIDPGEITICDILEVNDSIQKTLQGVIKTEMLLHYKMECAVKLDVD